jgi:hypothetical protein
LDSISRALAEIYLSIDHFQYFTLKNVRKSIEFFFKFYQIIQQREDVREVLFSDRNKFIYFLKIRLTRCESMLNRTNKSNRIIERNKQLVVQLQTDIDICQEKLSKLEELFRTKKASFSIVSLFFKE